MNVPLADDLKQEVRDIFATRWSKRDGVVVPEPGSVKLGNDAVEVKATVLYADLAGSTSLVDKLPRHYAAEVYKSYLACAARLVKYCGGDITAYDGDRIMGVFMGDRKNTSAAKCALHINWAVREVINPALKAQYPEKEYTVQQAVGIDTSELFVAAIGVRGANDLVWVGPAANYAAKLCTLRDGAPTWITKRVYDRLADEAKISKGRNMWEERTWTAAGLTVYRSTWQWSL